MSGVADGGSTGATDAAEPLLLAGVRLPGAAEPVDVHLASGRVAAIEPAGSIMDGASTRSIAVLEGVGSDMRILEGRHK